VELKGNVTVSYPIGTFLVEIRIPFALFNGTAEMVAADSSNALYVNPESSGASYKGVSFFLTIFNENRIEVFDRF
jgi:hypothetical protein